MAGAFHVSIAKAGNKFGSQELVCIHLQIDGRHAIASDGALAVRSNYDGSFRADA
jgi:hypothetical protein